MYFETLPRQKLITVVDGENLSCGIEIFFIILTEVCPLSI